jgi:hypothetical protein
MNKTSPDLASKEGRESDAGEAEKGWANRSMPVKRNM